jgi:hypothetical protein
LEILNKYDEELKKIKNDIKIQHKKIAQLNEMKSPNQKENKESKELKKSDS